MRSPLRPSCSLELCRVAPAPPAHPPRGSLACSQILGENPIPSAVQQHWADPSSPRHLPALALGRGTAYGAHMLQPSLQLSPRAHRGDTSRILRRMRQELAMLLLTWSNLSSSAQNCVGSLHPACDTRQGEGLIK